jgi:hypothetical protein
MLTNKILITCFIGVLLAACGDDSSTEAKTEEPATQAASTTANAPANPVQKKETDKIDEAIFALKFFSAGERDKAAVEANRIFGEIQMRAATLEGKADAATLIGFKDKTAAAKAEIDKLTADKDTVWWKIANAYATALLNNKRAYDQAAAALPK